MAIEQKRKVIEGTTYLVTQMNAIKALKVQAKLVSLIGPKLGKLTTQVEGKLDINALLPLLGEVFSGIDADALSTFVLSLFDSGVFTETTQEGIPVPLVVNFDTHFVGKVTEMWQVAAFILEANFAKGNS